MALYSASVDIRPAHVGVGATAAAIIADIKASATARTSLLELVCSTLAAGSTLSFQLARSVAETLPVGQVPFVPEDPSDIQSTTTLASAWSVAPTAPTSYFRRNFVFPGQGLIWTFPSGLGVNPSNSLLLTHAGSGNSISNPGQCFAQVNE